MDVADEDGETGTLTRWWESKSLALLQNVKYGVASYLTFLHKQECSWDYYQAVIGMKQKAGEEMKLDTKVQALG